jgi:predicted metal-binding protein
VVDELRKTRFDLRGQLGCISGSSVLGSLSLAESLFENALRIVSVVVCQQNLGCRLASAGAQLAHE